MYVCTCTHTHTQNLHFSTERAYVYTTQVLWDQFYSFETLKYVLFQQALKVKCPCVSTVVRDFFQGYAFVILKAYTGAC